MPYKPKHPCAADGCPELVEAGERYCEKHRKEAARTYEKYGRDRSVRRTGMDTDPCTVRKGASLLRAVP